VSAAALYVAAALAFASSSCVISLARPSVVASGPALGP
jgi:hypothetical protein